MNQIKLFLVVLLMSVLLQVQAAVVINGDKTVASYTSQEVTIGDKSALTLTFKTPLTASNVYLETEDSWLYFENLRPSEVVTNWLKYVFVGTEAAVFDVNVRVEIYKQGAVVIPHAPSYKPLTIFTEPNFGGQSASYEIVTYHNKLGDMDNTMRSFKLKKGYMATFASNSTGLGFSRVYIADTKDIEVPVLQAELDKTVSFIRVFKWRWVSQKGWCGSNTTDLSLLNATWCYDWDAIGPTNYIDAEYIPMRHNANWQGWDAINARNNSTHVLGFNEPNQAVSGGGSAMTVQQCLDLWPNLMKSGLRIGSPAPTDGGLAYLYEFVDKCDALGYRVDFIAVHFYRGGQTPRQYYDFLKGIHQRTGRPIWITEWNNGANWTTESNWPSDLAGQQTKQLNDMTGFFNMLDTVSFVERHAVYNWVEQKRYVIDAGQLTPAGTMMSNYKSSMAYNPAKEFLPKPYVFATPTISSSVMSSDRTKYTVTLGANVNGDLATALLVEKQINNDGFVVVDSILDLIQVKHEYTVDKSEPGRVSFRYRYVGLTNRYSPYSKEVSYFFTPEAAVQLGTIGNNSSDWSMLLFGQPFAATPIALFGTISNTNTAVPMTHTVRNLVSQRLEYRLYPWLYITKGISTVETTPYCILPAGNYDLNNIKAEAKQVTANGTWQSYSFDTPFETVPVVFAMQTSTNVDTPPLALRIKNVTTTGFDLLVQKEASQTVAVPMVRVNYLAITEGTGVLDGNRVIVGKTAENELGTSTSKAVTVNWGETLTNPLFFSSIQTANDEKGAGTRLKSINETQAAFFKQTETSATALGVKLETAGWMVIESPKKASGIGTIPLKQLSIYPNPTTGILYVEMPNQGTNSIYIYSMHGNLVKEIQTSTNEIDLSDLLKGQYILYCNGKAVKVVKI